MHWCQTQKYSTACQTSVTLQAPQCVSVLDRAPQIWQLPRSIHSHLPDDPAVQICSKIQIWLLRTDPNLITEKAPQISDCNKTTKILLRKLSIHNIIACLGLGSVHYTTFLSVIYSVLKLLFWATLSVWVGSEFWTTSSFEAWEPVQPENLHIPYCPIKSVFDDSGNKVVRTFNKPTNGLLDVLMDLFHVVKRYTLNLTFPSSFTFGQAGWWWWGEEEGPNLIRAKTGMSSDPNEIQTWLRKKAVGGGSGGKPKADISRHRHWWRTSKEWCRSFNKWDHF